MDAWGVIVSCMVMLCDFVLFIHIFAVTECVFELILCFVCVYLRVLNCTH